MIQPTGVDLEFSAFFVESKLGKTGLTVTVDVYRNSSLVITGGSATEIGGGLYGYTLNSSYNTTAGSYRAVFKTATSTVDQQHVPSLVLVGWGNVANLDAAVSTRLATAGYTAPPSAGSISTAVWSEGTRTITGTGTDAITAASIAASAISEIQSGLSTLDASGVRTAIGLASANLDTQLSAIAGYIDTEVSAIYTRIGAPAGASIAADLLAIKNETASILADTGTDGVLVASAAQTAIADATLKRDFSAVSSPSARSALEALRLLRNKSTRVGTTLTVMKEDDATTAWTAVLTTDAAADPITGVDPA